MIGSGIFAVPSAFGRSTGGAGALVAWAIAGGGMLMLAFVFQTLSLRRPDLDTATVYAAGMIYAGGLKFLLLSAVLYAPGTALYFLARREQKKKLFTVPEMIVFAVLVVAAVAALFALNSGAIAV
jgi:hypothetical protein